jgi:hypothetical protein
MHAESFTFFGPQAMLPAGDVAVLFFADDF